MSVDNRRDGPDDALLQSVGPYFAAHRPAQVGVAVSGGGDSMALLHLMHRVAAGTGAAVAAVTVDHGLRPAAAAEAALVAATCAGLGLTHDTLRWEHGPIAGNLMDQARRARYRLMSEWAKARGIGHLVLGHTADDQAETFLMGLARRSGLDGLSGMRATWRQDGVVWSRPLLLHGRDELRAYLRRHAIPWVEDPTNEDAGFTRIRARRALKALKPLGITVGTLSAVTAHLDQARSALVATLSQVAGRVAREEAGALQLDRAAFLALPLELQRRMLIAALRWIAGAEYPPREAALDRVQSAILGQRDATLSGCRILVSATGIRITREPKAIAGTEGATDRPWDGRWLMEGPHAGDLTVRMLGAEGLRLSGNWRTTGIGRDVLAVSPAVWRGDALVAAPLAGVANGWTARIAASFSRSILSH